MSKSNKLGLIVKLVSRGELSDANKELKEYMEQKILEVTEARRVVIKVNSKGQRTRKIKCGAGKKLKNGKCVVQSSSEKLSKKKAIKKAIRTKRAGGAGAKRKANIKRQKALKKRRAQGL